MTDLVLKSIYQTTYLHLITLLHKQEKGSDAYKGCVALLEDYRDFVKRVAQLDDLPEVPKG